MLRDAGFCCALIDAYSLTPVAIAGPEPSEPPTSPAAMPLIELEFGRGIRLRILGAVDPALAAAVMRAMPRRRSPFPSGVRVWIATGHTDMRRA
jgi:hypothetical protein